MKNYNLLSDINLMMDFFRISTEELAENVGVSRAFVNHLVKGECGYTEQSMEKFYSYFFNNEYRFDLNKTKEMIYKDDANGRLLLFHGAKDNIDGEIDNKHSSLPKDFGAAFYAGESLRQAATWVCNFKNSSVYAFYLKKDSNLKILELNANRDWLYIVMYYRNAFKDYEINNVIRSLINKVEESDLIIAPIADNEMFKTIDSFSRSEITDEACLHALAATNLGKQYVFKSMKACQRLEEIDRMYLCEKEKEHYLSLKNDLSNEGIQKARLALIKYRREGSYFDELFKRKR